MENPTLNFDMNLFKQRLNETILWCRHKIAQSTTHTSEILWSLADQALVPSNSEGYRSHRPDKYLADVPLVEYANRIFAQRSQLLATLPTPPSVVPDGTLMGGRLVVFFPDWTLSDGAAEKESNDFFDADNVPACDTWVYFSDKHQHLLSWVPPEYRHDAEEGISVNPERCLCWLDDEDALRWNHVQIPYLALLKSAGFA